MRYIPKFLTISAIAMLSTASNAEIIPVDFLNDGDKLLTLDDTTDRAWLDWSYTAGSTYNTIYARTRNPDDVLFGFQYASTSDVGQLGNSLGLIMGRGWQSASSNNSYRLSENLGVTLYSTYKQTFGITDTKDSYNRSLVVALTTDEDDARYEFRSGFGTAMQGDADKVHYGHALYKENWSAIQTPSVPEPGTIALFGMALAGFASRKLFSA